MYALLRSDAQANRRFRLPGSPFPCSSLDCLLLFFFFSRSAGFRHLISLHCRQTNVANHRCEKRPSAFDQMATARRPIPGRRYPITPAVSCCDFCLWDDTLLLYATGAVVAYSTTIGAAAAAAAAATVMLWLPAAAATGQ